MLKKYRLQILGILAVICVLIAAVVPALLNQRSTLLNKSRKVVTLNEWDAEHSNYFWLSNQDALFLRQTKIGKYKNETAVTATTVDANTGASTQNMPLETALNKLYVNDLLPQWLISPDRKWLLGKSESGHGADYWVATSLMGMKQIKRPYQGYDLETDLLRTAFSPDSKSWIQTSEINSKTHIFSYRFDTPIVSEHIEDFMLSGRTLVSGKIV